MSSSIPTTMNVSHIIIIIVGSVALCFCFGYCIARKYNI